MHIPRHLVHVPQPPHHLSEHHPRVVLRQRRATIALQNVKQAPSGAVRGKEEIGVRRAVDGEEGEDEEDEEDGDGDGDGDGEVEDPDSLDEGQLCRRLQEAIIDEMGFSEL